MLKKYTIKVCINIEFVKDPTNSQKNILELASSIEKMTSHLAAATDVAEYINKPQDEQHFPLEAILRTYYGDEVKIGVEHYPKGKTVYTVPYLTITEEPIDTKYHHAPIGLDIVGRISGMELHRNNGKQWELLEQKWEILSYKGVEYKCRVIPNQEKEIDDEDDFSLLIAPKELLETLNLYHKEDVALDQTICYYATPEQMQLSDLDLYNEIYHLR